MRKLLAIAIALNLIGALYGFVFFYGARLLTTPLHLLPFVPDCPLYALLFALTLILLHKKRKANWFYFLSAVGAMKYGFWTVFVLAFYSPFYFTPEYSLMYSMLFVAHIGMLLEPSLLPGKVRTTAIAIAISLAWFLLNDVVDYILGVYPSLPTTAPEFMFPATVAMTLFFSALAAVLFLRARKPLIGLFRDGEAAASHPPKPKTLK